MATFRFGLLSLTRVDVEILDSFYSELRRCRDHCGGRRPAVSRTSEDKSHVCRGLANSTVRQIHWITSGALDRAVVWQWIAVDPAERANKPSLPHPDPKPPTAAKAARLVERALIRDPDWGALAVRR